MWRAFCLFILFFAPQASYSQHVADYQPIMGDDVPTDLQIKIRDNIAWLMHVRGNGATNLHRRIFGGDVDGRIYGEWLKKRLRQIKVDPAGCRDITRVFKKWTPGGCVRPSLFGQRHVAWLTPRAAKLSDGGLLLMVAHEAQHLAPEGRYRHSPCENPKEIGKDCDRNELGAYTTTAVLVSNLANYCNNCQDEKSKKLFESLMFHMVNSLQRLEGPARESYEQNLRELNQ